jgi:hypothetical protein
LARREIDGGAASCVPPGLGFATRSRPALIRSSLRDKEIGSRYRF